MDELREKRAMIGDARNRAAQLAAELEDLEAQVAAAEEARAGAERAFADARQQLQAVSQEVRRAASAAMVLGLLVAQLLTAPSNTRCHLSHPVIRSHHFTSSPTLLARPLTPTPLSFSVA